MRHAPSLQVDLASPRPAYEQIVAGLRAHLVSGAFEPGDRLPTVRQLATDLGVHHNTVAEAYRLLTDEGWLDLRRGRGATVIDRRNPKPTTRSRQSFITHLEQLAAKAIADGVPKATIAEQMAALVRKFSEG